ncbi:ABC transporter substrate-binding protein [Peptoniphilus rhinitidis]|uniref:ABC transporter substrate-binding protein n=1 Tax=Peptoniphilus rhinitidis TaxID=1175452 RepID=UPI000288DFF3|nr:ABC transporter substrate-binding protein [Peptoniphilus rhinitidis]
MKKITKRLLIILCALMLFTGCSNASKTAMKEDDQKENSGGPTEIEFWYGLGSVAGETMEEIIKEFNESQDKVKVVGVQQADYAETFQKVQAAVAAKKPPAVYIGSNVELRVKDGMLADLSEYIDDKKTPLDDYLDVFMKPEVIDGKVYGFPAYGTTQVIYYRKDLLDKAGLDPKKVYDTWEDVFKYSKEIQDKKIADYGHLVMYNHENLIDMALSNGGKILSDDGKKVLINSREWIDAWNFVRKQIFDDKTTKIESGGQGWEYWYRTIDDVMNGDAMSYTGSSGDKGDLDFTKISSLPQPGLNGNPGKPVAGAHSLLVPAAATKEQQKAAYEWIAYFTSPEVSAKWSKKIGYIPVRKSAAEVDDYKKFIEENPYANVPYEQAMHASPAFIDPTDGKITDALSIAADKVELQNIDAKEALDEAAKTAQEALDAINK